MQYRLKNNVNHKELENFGFEREYEDGESYYGKYLDDEAVIRDNPLFMILRLLQFCEVSSIALAGFDGYDMFKTLF